MLLSSLTYAGVFHILTTSRNLARRRKSQAIASYRKLSQAIASYRKLSQAIASYRKLSQAIASYRKDFWSIRYFIIALWSRLETRLFLSVTTGKFTKHTLRISIRMTLFPFLHHSPFSR
jgi:hypothetical protein